MTVQETAFEVIRLAESRNAENETIEAQLGFEVGYEWGSESAWKALIAPRPAERSLIDYLTSADVHERPELEKNV